MYVDVYLISIQSKSRKKWSFSQGFSAASLPPWHLKSKWSTATHYHQINNSNKEKQQNLHRETERATAEQVLSYYTQTRFHVVI